MKTFTDNCGPGVDRHDQRRVHQTRARRCSRSICSDAVEGQLIERLVTDPVLLCDCVYAVCKPEADARGITDEDFGRAMAGDVIEHACTALLEELVDFFPQPKRQVLAKALLRLRQLEAKAIALASTRLDDPRWDETLEAALARHSSYRRRRLAPRLATGRNRRRRSQPTDAAGTGVDERCAAPRSVVAHGHAPGDDGQRASQSQEAAPTLFTGGVPSAARPWPAGRAEGRNRNTQTRVCGAAVNDAQCSRDPRRCGVHRALHERQPPGEGPGGRVRAPQDVWCGRPIGRLQDGGGRHRTPDSFLSAVKHFASAGDALNKMSQRTGVSVEVLSELAYAAEQSGTDVETLEASLRKMQKQLVEAAGGSKSAVAALSALGLSVTDLGRLSPDAQFRLIAERLSQIRQSGPAGGPGHGSVRQVGHPALAAHGRRRARHPATRSGSPGLGPDHAGRRCGSGHAIGRCLHGLVEDGAVGSTRGRKCLGSAADRGGTRCRADRDHDP